MKDAWGGIVIGAIVYSQWPEVTTMVLAVVVLLVNLFDYWIPACWTMVRHGEVPDRAGVWPFFEVRW